MNSLHELQTRFAAAVHGEPEAIDRLPIRKSGVAPARRFRIYQNNVYAAYTGALESSYPVVQALVGEDFFAYAARLYIRRYPSTSGDLNDYGDRYPRFIAGLPQARELPYLEDVAALEWAMQEVARAEAPEAFNIRGLASVPPARYPELRFRLHPASRILRSEYPVLAIWRMHQPDAPAGVTVKLRAGGVRLLVIRRGREIELEPLSLGEHAMLAALAAGDPFDAAAESALQVEPEFAITTCMRDHVARRTIVDFHF